jgi:DNA replication protein DnaC
MKRVAEILKEKHPQPDRMYFDMSARDYLNLFKKIGRELTGDYKIDKINSHALDQYFLWLRGSDQFEGNVKKGIVLIGNYGTGKTTFARIMARVYSSMANKNFHFLSTIELTGIIKSGNKDLDFYSTRPLVLDEIGREVDKVVDYGTTRKPVEELLTMRYNKDIILTFGTSNFDYKDLCDRYGNYLGDRFKEMFNFIIMDGESRRK